MSGRRGGGRGGGWAGAVGGRGGNKGAAPVLPPPGLLEPPWEVFLKFLPYDTDEASLQGFLEEKCGGLAQEPVLLKDSAGSCKGAGWATFADEEAMRAALALDGTEFGGRHLQITIATRGQHQGAKLDAPTGTVQEAGTHTPALCEQVVQELIAPDPGALYVDATFGRGGHSGAMLATLSKRGRLHAFDMDPEAVAKGEAMQADKRFTMHHASFSSMASVPELLGEEASAEPSPGPGTSCEGAVAGVLFDLGISSPQLDGERGFRPEQDAELDMRFDTSRGKPVWRWLRRAPREDMAYVFRELGGEDAAASRRIADAVALARGADGKGVPKRTREFADLVQRAKGGKEYQAMHPAKLAFQALRIYVNREFDELREGMAAALRMLRGEARMGLITWKHKECGIVIDFFRQHECARPDHPLLQWYEREAKDRSGGRLKPRWGLLQEDPIRPTAAELKVNSRARSAVLHLFRKRKALLLPQLENLAYSTLGWPSPSGTIEPGGQPLSTEPVADAGGPGEAEHEPKARKKKRRRQEEDPPEEE